jgi:hypothetical protein
MSICELVEDDKASRIGLTLLSKGSTCMKPTSVFLPTKHAVGSRELNVILWLHGYYIESNGYLFRKEDTKVRQGVENSGKDFVVIAPFLGEVQPDGTGKAAYSANAFSGTGCQRYLEQIVEALGRWLRTCYGTAAPSNLTIKNLVVAGHSGGGTHMLKAVDALDDLKSKLRECWGFDCLYGSGKTWADWAGKQGINLYFYFGLGTRPGTGGQPLEFWKEAYGTPKQPKPSRMRNVFLAPAVTGVELDRAAFQSVEEIKQKAKPGSRYEEIRKEVDPLLDDETKYWAKIKPNMKGHYAVAADLLGPRIAQSGIL